VAPTHTPEDDFADAVRVRGRDGKWIVDINAGKRVRRDVNGVFVHVVSAPVIKWVARTRAGALATPARKAKSPVCPCCGHPTDDDSHVVAECSSTGAADCGEVASRMWMQAACKRGAHMTPLLPHG